MGSEAIKTAQLRLLADFRFQLRKFLHFSELACRESGVAVQHYQLLQAIASAPERARASISYVAERMILRQNSMVELVDRAELAGLVQRQGDTCDQRRCIVALTQLGWAKLEYLAAQHLRDLDKHGPSIIEALQRVWMDVETR